MEGWRDRFRGPWERKRVETNENGLARANEKRMGWRRAETNESGLARANEKSMGWRRAETNENELARGE